MLLVAGSRLDSYEIIAPLGAGGMGEVYRARDALLKRDVAIKVLPDSWSRDPERLQRSEQAAQATAALTRQTDPGDVVGTVGYMAPEQVRGGAADARSDIFAFGVILYEMLTGRRAFQKDTSAETMSAILNEEPPPVSQTGQSVPPPLQRIVSRCLEKKPGRRFQQASHLAFAVETLSDSGST